MLTVGSAAGDALDRLILLQFCQHFAVLSALVMSVHCFGIRHHGPGSARSLVKALQTLQPDLILIEGPADAQEMIPLAAHAEMKPPVAMLLYTNDTQQAIYYPLAVFSPEWQAIQYGLKQNIAIRLIDLPQTYQFALLKEYLKEQEAQAAQDPQDSQDPQTPQDPQDPQVSSSSDPQDTGALDPKGSKGKTEASLDPLPETSVSSEIPASPPSKLTPHPEDQPPPESEDTEDPLASSDSLDSFDPFDPDFVEDSTDLNPDDPEGATEQDLYPDFQAIRQDPLSWLAQAAGYSDGENWWEHLIEQRQDSTDMFVGIAEAMTILRQEVEALQTHSTDSLTPPQPPPTWIERREVLREAHMRQAIRAAGKEGFQTIAVICGAWHVPALQDPLPPAKADQALLKGLPKLKTMATWVPWTYERLSYTSGYGAGIHSPGWYDHLWSHPQGVSIQWITRVARLLREEDLDASSANVIEAVRLADALAALRDRPRPSLEELNEAVETVFCFGDTRPLNLIHDRLIISNCLGEVPDETPAVPLQQDLQRIQKRLRLKLEPDSKSIVLDLRKPNDLEKSQLLHRLNLLNVAWGTAQGVEGTGTFKEGWRLKWKPEFAVNLIEASVWGNTVLEAAAAKTSDQAAQVPDLPSLTQLLDRVLLADLPTAVDRIMDRIQIVAAVSSDITHLMSALPSLANVLRYSDVRKTNIEILSPIVDGMVTRICVGLPAACASLNDDAAAVMHTHVMEVNAALRLLQKDPHLQEWYRVLEQLSQRQGLHGLLAGRCCRLLLDAEIIDDQEAARRLNFALSRANDPADAAAWIEGLLQGSGLVLLHHQHLWAVLDSWVTGLTPDDFTATLPLLRRTFSTFSAPERRQMGAQIKQGMIATSPGASEDQEISESASGDAVLPLLAQLLGVTL